MRSNPPTSADRPFDPYLKWFGIHPKDRPANYYRLLGIEMFEDDAEVISNAADSRLRHLGNLAKGVHQKSAKRIGREIAAARDCLLNSATRSHYDQRLRNTRLDGELDGEANQANSKPPPANRPPVAVPPEPSPPPKAPPPPQKTAVADQPAPKRSRPPVRARSNNRTHLTGSLAAPGWPLSATAASSIAPAASSAISFLLADPADGIAPKQVLVPAGRNASPWKVVAVVVLALCVVGAGFLAGALFALVQSGVIDFPFLS